MLAKDYSSYTVYQAWLQSSTRKPQWFQYLKLVFLEIPNVTTWLVFQNQVTIYVKLYCSNLYEVKKGCLQCEVVDNLFPSAIKRAITREELSRHCWRRTCGEVGKPVEIWI